MTSLTLDLQQAIARTAGVMLHFGHAHRIGGGSINTCWRIATRVGEPLFLKLNEPDCEAMFAAEAEGLRELRAAGAVRVPQPLGHGATASAAWLLMEYLDLASGSPLAAGMLGSRLALQHRHTASEFGWQRDNTIGSTLQRNVRQADWLSFFRTYRLEFQLHLAAENDSGAELQDKGARLLQELPRFFEGYAPAPSLLHGDLWGGNWAMTSAGEPVIFDPAVYYGDREADIAMTELFGRFPQELYVAYEAAWPLDPGYARRKHIYNLYHVLNHLNLFGGAYLQQAVALIDGLLSDVR